MTVSCTVAIDHIPSETSLNDLTVLFTDRAPEITDFLVRIYTGPDEVIKLTAKDCEPDAIGLLLKDALNGGQVKLLTRYGAHSWPAGAIQAVHAYIATDGVL